MSRKSTILKFSLNGVPILGRDGNDKWHVLENVDTNFENDPRDIFHTDNDAQTEKLSNIAASVNASVQSMFKPK